MTLMRALSELETLGQAVFRSADVIAALRIPKAHASQVLSRLAAHGQVLRLKRGLWALTGRTDPLSLTPHLTAPYPSYVSLQTALYHRGVIDQIPQVIYAVSLARTQTYMTPVGTYSVHHLPSYLFFGFEEIGETRVPMATAEKALMDLLYLGPARSRLFGSLPEVDLEGNVSLKKLKRMIVRIRDDRRRTMVRRRLERLLARDPG